MTTRPWVSLKRSWSRRGRRHAIALARFAWAWLVTNDQTKDATCAAARGRAAVVVDMSRTHFCDTAGLHALVGAHRRAQAEGSRVLLVVSANAVLRILAITGLDRVLARFSSLDDALAAAPATQPDDRSSPEGTIEVG